AVAVGAAREEAAVQLEERRRGRDDAGAEEERDYECGKADAAASSSSKSGTSPVSYRHAPPTVPSASIRNAARPDTSRSWRKSCPTPKRWVASPFQSESSPKSRSSACAHETCVHGESREMPNGRTPARSNSALLSRRSSISFVQVDDQSKR